MKSLLMDMNNAIHRTWWTAKNIVGEEDTEKLNNFHIYFTLNAIRSYVALYKPDRVIAAWDEKPDYQKNDRKAMFEGYKGNRSSDASPHRNNEKIKEFLTTLGIPSIFPRQLEADDVIAFLADTLAGSSVIVSVDKDFLQLVSDSVIVFDPIRKKETTVHNFSVNTGCEQKDFVTIKCLAGDKSDNVPGIYKFGKVKIKKYLDGEIILTEDEQAIFDRNFELFRLDRFADGEYMDELMYYEGQMDGVLACAPDYHRFIELCEEHDIQSILGKRGDWYNLFFMKSKLLSMFA